MPIDPDTSAAANVGLSIAGEVYIAQTLGSYPAQPDNLLFLDDILALGDSSLRDRLVDAGLS